MRYRFGFIWMGLTLLLALLALPAPSQAQNGPDLMGVDTTTPLTNVTSDVINGAAVTLNMPADWEPFNTYTVGVHSPSLAAAGQPVGRYRLVAYPLPPTYGFERFDPALDALAATEALYQHTTTDTLEAYTLHSAVLGFDLPSGTYAEFLFEVDSTQGAMLGAWGFVERDGRLIMLRATMLGRNSNDDLAAFLALHATGRAVIDTLTVTAADSAAETNPNWALDTVFNDASGAFSFQHPERWLVTSHDGYDLGSATFAVSAYGSSLSYRLRLEGFLSEGYFRLNAPNAATTLRKLTQGIVSQNYLAGFVEVSSAEMMLGAYSYAEVVWRGRADYQALEDRLYGLLDAGGGYYVYFEALMVEGDPIQRAQLIPMTRAIMATFTVNDAMIAPAVPFVWDPAAPADTTVTPLATFDQPLNNEPYGYSVRLTEGYTGVADNSQLIITGPQGSRMTVGLLTFEDPLVEQATFGSAGILLASIVPLRLQAIAPPSTRYAFLTGVNSFSTDDFSTDDFSFNDGDYADVIFRQTRADGHSDLVIWGVRLIDGEIVSFWHQIPQPLGLADEAVFALAADTRAIAATFSPEAQQ